MRRTISICWVVAAILLSVCTGADAQQVEPTLSVMVGFDGYCRQGAWCPVRVLLANDGAGIEGDVVVTPPGEDRATDVYMTRVVLPPQSRKAVLVYVPVRFSYGTPRIVVRLIVDGRDVARQVVNVRLLSVDDYLYVVASSNPSTLNLLGAFAPAGNSATVAHVSLDALPPDPLGWEAFDVLILNDVDTTAVDAARVEALTTWIVHGGRLVVGGGAGAARTAVGLGALLPVAPGALRTVANLDALGSYANAAALPGPYAVVDSTPLRGETVIEQDGLPLVSARSLGAGRVLFLAYDAGVAPFATQDDSIYLWGRLLDLRSPGVLSLGLRDEYAASQAITLIPGLGPPPALQVLAFLLVYIALIGPINYLLLLRLKRRELAWLTIPLLALVFTVIAYLTGFQVRGRTPIVHRVASVHVPAGAETGRVTQLVGIFSPRRARYDVLSGAAVPARIGDYTLFGEDVTPLTIANDAEGWTVQDLQVDIGGLRSFVTEGYASVTPPQSTMQMQVTEGDKTIITGTVVNGSIALHDAVLIVGGSEYALGDLEPGQVVSELGESVSSSMFAIDPWWMLDDRDADQLRQRFFMTALARERRSPLRASAYLVGWADSAPLDVTLAGHNSIPSDLALFAFELPLVASVSSGAVRVPADLVPWVVEDSSGYVGSSPAIEIYSRAWIVLRFQTWPGIVLDRVDSLVLNLDVPSVGRRLPAVDLWNWQDGNWDRHAVEWGYTVIPNPTLYFGPDGVIRMRLQSPQGESVVIDDLGIALEGWRE